LDAYRSAAVGFVFQSFFLLPNLTALENVQLPMFEGKWSSVQRVQRARELLATVGMSHRADQLPTRLSVGERQRVAVARALANGPSVVLADEPTGNLDSHNTQEILDLFATLHRDHNTTLVMVTHEVEVAERTQRVVQMRDGRIVADERVSSPH
jgi:putative ABC transport system ATP-binding protein